MKNLFLILFLIAFLNSFSQNDLLTRFEKSKGLETNTYFEVIDFYKKLANKYPQVKVEEIGMTDSGYPLHLVTVDMSRQFDYEKAHSDGKSVILINNGIHPGEPDGIDACMMLVRDYLSSAKLQEKINSTVLAIIPIYNIGGALNRNSHSRANQNGPKEYGFRGNAQNLDLNRDFIKMDSKNAFAFTKIYHKVKPDMVIDTHVSNGADYQYNITHLTTQANKLGGKLGEYLRKKMVPKLESRMFDKKEQIVPYVNVFNKAPDDDGYMQFMDTPRYATGYTALFYSLGVTIETHMLKPYDVRVEATRKLIETIIEIMDEDRANIKSIRQSMLTTAKSGKEHVIQWRLDRSRSRVLNFRGYTAEKIKSKVTGQNRLFYNHEKPYTKPLRFYYKYIPNKSIIAPKYYVIPRGWHKVVDRLIANAVTMQKLNVDTTLSVEAYRIVKYNTSKSAYEAHYPHNSVEVEKIVLEKKFLNGDLLIPVNQPAGRFLIEVLEPHATDSYFNWNFFDTILQQKEHFSPYVFEDIAAKLLLENDELRREFEAKKKINPDFANDWYAQLNFIYKKSPYFESAFMLYPVYRVIR